MLDSRGGVALTVLRDEAQAPRRGRFGTRPKPADLTASVLVPVLNEEAHLPETVPPMLGQRFEGKIEFLFIDGGSTDGSLAILEALAEVDNRIRILPNPRRQTTTALNIGLEHAQGEFVVRMDAHSMYPDNYVARGVERLLEGDVEWVSGPAIAEGTGRWSAPVSAALKTPLGQGGSRKWAPGAAEVELDTGVFTGVWRRSYLEEIGRWDEGWPVNQDSELAARVFERGGRIVCLPELAASYSPRNSPKGLARQYWRYGYYRTKTSRRHPSSMRRSHVLIPALLVTLFASVAAPRRIRRAAQALMAVYLTAIFGVSVRAAQLGEAEVAEATRLPVVFAIMHLAWGAGFFAACVRFGLPLEALRRLAGRSPGH